MLYYRSLKGLPAVLQIVINVMLPVILIGGLGFIFQRSLRPTVGSINQLVFYVMAPCLTFSSLSRIQISGQEMGQIFVYGVLYVVAMSALGLAVSAIFRWERAVSRAFIISLLMINGNYAFSVALLALGQPGMDRSVVFSVIQGTLATTVAVFFASNSSEGVRASILAVLKRPSIYATVLALAMNALDLHFPPAIQTSLEMVGAANIPVVLIIMGMQMALGVALDAPVATGVAVFTRLVGSVVVAYLLTGLLGMEGLTRHVMLLYAAMPTAIMATVISTEFDARPRFVAGVVIISTALSIATVSLWLVALASAFGQG